MEKRINGFKINKQQCISKLISRQKGDPANLISEALDNLLDEYTIHNFDPVDRVINIHSNGRDTISLCNQCIGLSEEDLQNLVTIGGTAKQNSEQSLYGIRGIGILSILNPELVDEFEITFFYRPIKAYRRLIFYWDEDDIYHNIVEPQRKDYPFTCEYHIRLISSRTFLRVKNIIERRLYYLPYPSYYNSELFDNQYKNSLLNRSDERHQVAIKAKSYNDVEYLVLNNYKYIRSFYSTPSIIHGGYNKTDSLLDEYIDGFFHRRTPYSYLKILFPFVKNVNLICNSNNLNLTTSKENIYLDYAYHNLLQFTKTVILEYLLMEYDNLSEDLILNNLYIFKEKLLESITSESIEESDLEKVFVSRLLDSRIWRIVNSSEKYSLRQIYLKIKDSEKPLFYTIKGDNLNFAYGRFKHSFILSASRGLTFRSDPVLFDKILAEVFTPEDSFNLDNIYNDPDKIERLVERGVVNAEDLFPKVTFKETRDLSFAELEFISLLSKFFNKKKIKRIISKILFYEVDKINIGLYDVVNGDTGVLNASFFNADGEFLLDNRLTNFKIAENIKYKNPPVISLDLNQSQKVFLGLNRGSFELNYVIRNSADQPIEYALMYVCTELVSTQKYIASDTQIYYRLRNNLLQEIWDYVIESGTT